MTLCCRQLQFMLLKYALTSFWTKDSFSENNPVKNDRHIHFSLRKNISQCVIYFDIYSETFPWKCICHMSISVAIYLNKANFTFHNVSSRRLQQILQDNLTTYRIRLMQHNKLIVTAHFQLFRKQQMSLGNKICMRSVKDCNRERKKKSYFIVISMKEKFHR